MGQFDDEVLLAVSSAVISRNGWFRANCPACIVRSGKEDKRWSLGFRPDTGFYSCFRCGFRGRIRGDFVGMLEQKAPVVDDSEARRSPAGYEPLFEEPNLSAMCTRGPRQYLERRNVSEQIGRAVGIGYCDRGLHHDRIIVPIKTIGESRWLGWVGRVWRGNPKLRYRYPGGMQRGSLLFNQDALNVETDEPVIVVEGVFDALPHWPYAVACLGKPTRQQLPLLCSTARPIVVALDGDAWQEGEALSLRLQLEGKRAAFIRLPPCTDPGELKPGELLAMARARLNGKAA